MQPRLALIVLAVFVAVAAEGGTHAAQTRGRVVRVNSLKLDRWYPRRRGRVHITVRYPQVAGLANNLVQGRINRVLRGAYPPGGILATLRGADSFFGERPEDRGVVVRITGRHQVTLNQDHLLSVSLEGDWTSWQHAKQYGIHPDPYRVGVTVDTRTGRVLRWSDLFGGAGWRERLDGMIARRAVEHLQAERERERRTRKPLPPGQTLGFDDSDWTVDDVLDDVTEHRYGYYLTPGGVVFYDLFSSHALAGVQAKLLHSELRSVRNPTGPLVGLDRPATGP